MTYTFNMKAEREWLEADAPESEREDLLGACEAYLDEIARLQKKLAEYESRMAEIERLQKLRDSLGQETV